jgi:CRISPR/Cas system-associated endonuclease Cas1
VDLKTFQNQTAKPKRLNEKLWHEMLRGKTLNQSRVLQHKQLRSPHLDLALKQEVFDEGNCARRYWQLYFPAIGWSASRRDRKEDTAPNQMLNYGYSHGISLSAGWCFFKSRPAGFVVCVTLCSIFFADGNRKTG